MASLSAHLRQPDDHARLAFHPECPLCRERVSGVLPADAIVSPRTQAFVAAGVLAFASGTPTTALAAVPPDQEQEGQAAPGTAPTDPTVGADFDPGGALTDLPLAAGPAVEPQTSPDDDAVVVDEEAATDADGVVADPADDSLGSDVGLQPPQAQAAPSPAAMPAPTEATTVADEPAPSSTPPPPTSDPAAASEVGQRGISGSTQQRMRVPSRRPDYKVSSTPRVVAPSTVSYVTPAVETAQPHRVSNEASVARDGRAARGDRVHVVRPGESLWSIARDLLGRDASVAAVAREVNRLWELNGGQIATGDPDLLIAGTRLALR